MLSSFCSLSHVLLFLTRLSLFLFDLLCSQRHLRFSSVSLLHVRPNLPFHSGVLPHGVDPSQFLYLFYPSWSKKSWSCLGTSAHFAVSWRNSEYLISLGYPWTNKYDRSKKSDSISMLDHAINRADSSTYLTYVLFLIMQAMLRIIYLNAIYKILSPILSLKFFNNIFNKRDLSIKHVKKNSYQYIHIIIQDYRVLILWWHYWNKENSHTFRHIILHLYIIKLNRLYEAFERGIISSTRTKRSSSLCLHGRPCQRRRGRSP